MNKIRIIFAAAVLAVAIAIIVLITALPTIFPDYGTDEKYVYNHFEFNKINGMWHTETMEGSTPLKVTLTNGPRDLESVPVRGDISAWKDSADRIYIAFDPNESVHTRFVTLTMGEVGINLVQQFGIAAQAACTYNHTDCKDAPKATCSADRPVILLNNIGTAKLDIIGTCAIISGKDEELVKAADRFMYGMYGIMR